MAKTDMQLKQDIEAELTWDPKVNAAHIGITVEQGAVTLAGTVDTYPEKWAAEDATKRVSGVRTVAQDLNVKVRGDHVRSDSELAVAVQNALKWDVHVPKTVTAKITHGSDASTDVTSGSVAKELRRELQGSQAFGAASRTRQPTAASSRRRSKSSSPTPPARTPPAVR